MDELLKSLPLFIPIILIQLGLQIYSLIDLYKREKVRFDNKLIWVLIILILNLFGPIIYIIFREDEYL